MAPGAISRMLYRVRTQREFGALDIQVPLRLALPITFVEAKVGFDARRERAD